MTQPTPYSRQYNFTNYQTVNPNSPLPANEVDLELSTIKSTLDQVLNNLKLIQRDDTALANQSVGHDQLKPEITIGINPPAPWVTGHAYIADDTVTTAGKFYLCLVSHTSGTFATDLGNGDWSLIIDFNGLSFDLAAATHGATAKTVPNDLDEFAQADSAQTWALKKITWAQMKAAVFSAFGNLISAGNVKSNPVSADGFAYMDSANSNATVVTTWSALLSTIFTAWGALIAAATAKATPVGADMVVIADSASSNATKKITLTSFFAAVFSAFGPLVAAATAKTTPVDGDGLVLSDSAASGAAKVITFTQAWTNYFKGLADALYQAKTTLLTAFVGLANTAGVLTNNGSGTLSWAAAAAGGQPIPTTNTFAIGTLAGLFTTSAITIADGSTTAGSNLNQYSVSNANIVSGGGQIQTGTWKNVCGVTTGSAVRGVNWVRTA